MTQFARSHPLAIFTLIAVNLIPLYGVLAGGWDLAMVLYLYWAESAVIGFYSILKLFSLKRKRNAFFDVSFFTLHFGGFMVGHALFLWILTRPSWSNSILISRPKSHSFFNYTIDTLGRLEPHWLLVIGAMFVSHGISYALNFKKNVVQAADASFDPMAAAYTRIFIMQFAIILGNFVVLLFNSTIGILAVLVIAKIVVDLTLHLRERGAERKTIRDAPHADILDGPPRRA